MRNINRRRFFYVLFFTVFLFVGNTDALLAQIINVTGSVEVVIEGKNSDGKGGKRESLPAGGCMIFWFNTKEGAMDFVKTNPKRPSKGVANYVYAGEDGSFNFSILVGGSLVVYHPDTQDKPKRYDVTAKDANKPIKFEFRDEGGIMLGDAMVKGKKAVMPTPKAKKSRVFGNQQSWTCEFPIPEGYGREDGRLIIQPYVLDCQTDDTIACLVPEVIEGQEYNNLQDRRMGFSYTPNDSLCEFYDSLHRLTDIDKISMTRYFIKPNVERSYYCVGDEYMEDYTHVYYKAVGFTFGSCFTANPFKFLDMNFGYNDIPLDRAEFYEAPSNQLIEQNRNLQLKFIVGQAALAQDSINDEKMNQLVQELKSYGNKLAQVKIIGCASPDGRLETNVNLARRRAEVARNILLKYVDTRMVQLPPVESKVYTWNDVVDSLVERGYPEEAEKIRVAAEANTNSAYAVAKELPIYSDVITQILNNQRAMECSYMYSRNSVLTPEDAVSNYYSNPDFRPGGKNMFTNGDYFNLLTLIKDPVDQRKIVERAYKENVARSGYKYNAFAAYLANRKALYAIADGIVDTTILKPFIDLRYKCDREIQISLLETSKWKVNRNQILTNQAIMYLKAGLLNYTEMYMNILPASSATKEEMQHYLNMIYYFLQYDDENSEEDIVTRGKEGLMHVMAGNPRNKAILNAELHEQLPMEPMDALVYVDSLLSDDDAVKWYLKGMLMSKKVGEEPIPGDGFVKMDDETLAALMSSDYSKYIEYLDEESAHEAFLKELNDGNDTPHFLAYFQHCFDLKPEYKKFYFSEGNIPKTVFDKHPYKEQDVKLYREKFEKLSSGFKPQKDNGSEQEPLSITDERSEE